MRTEKLQDLVAEEPPEFELLIEEIIKISESLEATSHKKKFLIMQRMQH